MLRRYWFVLNPSDRFGPKNIGVTALTKKEAVALINDVFPRYGLEKVYSNIDGRTEVFEDIDITLLDQNHVIPNMGVVTWKGIWFPNLNY